MSSTASPEASLPQKAFDPDEMEAVVAQDEFRDKMRTIMPWIVSFLAHLGVIIASVMIVWTVKAVLGPAKQDVVPMADVDDNDNPEMAGEQGTAGAVSPDQIIGGSPADNVPPPTEFAAPTPKVAAPSRPTPGVKAMAVSSFVAPPSAVTSPGARGSGSGIFSGDFGGGSGGGGTHGTGKGNHPAKRIVFLVDASGSLVDTMPFVLSDLENLLKTKIKSEKSFDIVFFSGKDVNAEIGAQKGIACLFPSLQPGTPENVNRASTWMMKVEAGGSGDPLAAIQKAFELKPDMIQILSDNITSSGIFELDQERFMAEFNKAREAAEKDRKGRIMFKTIQFVYPDPLQKIGKEPTLRRIVKESKGNPDVDYKFVSARDLGLR